MHIGRPVCRAHYARRSHVCLGRKWLWQLAVELGILELVFWLALASAIAISGWKVVVALRAKPWFPLAFAIWLYAVILLFPMMFSGSSAYEDFVLNSSLWLLLGILYRLKFYPKQYEMLQSQALPGQA